MSILSWLKSVAEIDITHPHALEFGKGEEQFLGLNMREALDAHIGWTHHIEERLKGVSLFNQDIGIVACDDMCVLGRWIHGEAKRKFGGSAEYDALKASHLAFHFTVGKILNEIENGDSSRAADKVKEVRRLSGNVQLDLVRLYAANND